MAAEKAAVVFVHGLWLHASSWGPWIEKFNRAGYAAIAPGWPGEPDSIEDARKAPEPMAGVGLGSVFEHYVTELARIGGKPIAIGHSFGGVIAQRLVTEGHASAAIALDPAPIKGVVYVPPSALKVASIALRNPLNRWRVVALSPRQFRYGFANAVSKVESKRLHETWTMPSPMRALFEAAVANVSPKSPLKVKAHTSARGPLLLVAGKQDHTAPPSVTQATRKQYVRSTAVTDYLEFDRGHSMPVDSGWSEVADAGLDWIRTQGF
jgi:non-heme chloroperoxidase